jgi:deoxyinosine 3'endonuclease (endonuclease V)
MSDWSVVSLCVHRYRGSRCERVWARDVVVRSAVPYHSGFLSFREAIPLMRVLLECYCDSLSGACCWPDVLVVDGNGRLHPQAGGLASHVAYMTRTPTVGVAKTLCHTDGLSRELSRGLRDCVDSRLVAGAWRRREEPGPLQETQETQAADAGDISSSAAFPALLELLLDQYRGQPAPEEPAAARPALPRASAEDLSALLSAAHDALATGRAAATLPAPCFPLLARSSLTLPPPGQPAAGAVLGEVLGLGVHAGLLHALQDTLGRTLKAGAKAGAAPVSPSAALARAVEEVARTNPVYVSVGAYVGLADALLLVLATSPCRVPESTRSADISGRAMVREIRSACSL